MPLLLLLLASLVAASPAAADTLPNEPVPTLAMDRYAGQWHEIARLPMYFERRCLNGVTAKYVPNADGTVRVENTCMTAKGQMSIVGMARVKEGQPGALEVRFAPGWLSWLPLSWADYWVIEVDRDYQWAVIGSPGHKHLWILARQPRMDRALFQTLKEHSRLRGYSVDDLIITAPLD
ncbi:lipocalin family protein [Rhodanobacter sp. AS-Z3]|uniref:lipocalin family protein n=1 Tax=Rhodanobacter sp. AS-Z3 TaxID=3031330 RepID=UPI002478869D|nr:lipocalin family protein [Rhodanobacter sp. AS-Z3]WEN14202.1 lipocalin family protein [Rhodanobacter sp. AS-Z3]